MKIINYSFQLLSIILLLSCEKKHDNLIPNKDLDKELIGNWFDTTYSNPKGLRIDQVTIEDNGVFKSKHTAYGIAEHQTIHDISLWTETSGFLKQNQDSLFLKITRWDNLLSQETKYNYHNNFEFWCTYIIVLKYHWFQSINLCHQ